MQASLPAVCVPNLSLVWLYSGSLAKALDKATWLETAGELSKLGWHVTLVASDFPEISGNTNVTAVRIDWARVYFVGFLVYHLRAAAYILGHRDQFSIVVSGPPASPFMLGLRCLGMFRRIKLPSMVLDLRSVPMAHVTMRERLRVLYFQLCVVIARYWMDGWTAITSRLASAVALPKERLLGVWPSGVKAHSFESARRLRSWANEQDPLRLIYIGTLTTERHILELCMAMRLVVDDGLRVKLKIIGGGPQFAALEEYARLWRSAGIQVERPVPHERVPLLLSEADVGVLPFPDEEKFRVSSPIKLMEYLAAGMPVLATRVVCHTDVLDDDNCVFWAAEGSPAALADAIREADKRKADLQAMGRVAAQKSEVWSWAASAKKLDAALRSLALKQGDKP